MAAARFAYISSEAQLAGDMTLLDVILDRFSLHGAMVLVHSTVGLGWPSFHVAHWRQSGVVRVEIRDNPVHLWEVQLSGQRRLQLSVDGCRVFEGWSQAGDVLFLPAGHQIALEASVRADVVQLLLPPTRASLQHEQLKPWLAGQERPPTHRHSLELMRVAFLGLHYAVHGTSDRAHERALLDELEPMIRDLRTHTATEDSEGPGLTLKKRRLIEGYILDGDADGLTLSAMAQAMGMSRCSFIRAFRRTFGRPPHQYVIEQRLERARRLLSDLDRKLLEIAMTCGFGSQSHFTTAFRQRLGISPSAYRQLFGDIDGKSKAAQLVEARR